MKASVVGDSRALAVGGSRTEASGVGDIRNLTHEDSIAKDSTATNEDSIAMYGTWPRKYFKIKMPKNTGSTNS